MLSKSYDHIDLSHDGSLQCSGSIKARSDIKQSKFRQQI